MFLSPTSARVASLIRLPCVQLQEVDCMEQFNAMQQCMGKNPEAFADVMQSMEGAIDQAHSQ